MKTDSVKTVTALLFVMFLFASTQAQAPKITSLIITPTYPHTNTVEIDGENISSTPIGGEFNPGWERCKPCSVGTEIPLSVNRTRNGSLGSIEIRGSTTLIINGVTYSWAVGWLEMIYNVPSVKLIKADNRRTPRYAREGNADMRIKLWRSDNEFPNGTPILDQSLQMRCTAYISFWRYRNFSNTSWLYDTKSYQWICRAVD